MRRRSFNKMISFFLLFMVGICLGQNNNSGFVFEETTIAKIHQAMKNGELTARELTEYYLKKIKLYDQSTKLNAILVINEKALEVADKLDEEFKQTGKLRPLHGIPIIVKDNYDTKDMQTAGGSLAMKGSIPPDDAYQVKKLREAGAIILAKSNMAEWAFSPEVTVNSIAGITRNPYDLERVPAGSSGGTAAAVAANFAVLGLGTDTGNSIRGPSSHCALTGIRSTMGLTSRDGIIPLYLRNDIGGPMARTVEDAVRVFEVIAGYDVNDPITKKSEGKVPQNYTQFLKKDGLKGARIGVLRTLSDSLSGDSEIKKIFEKAIIDLRKQGAVIVDSIYIPNLLEESDKLWCRTFRYDVNNYLQSLGDNAPYKNIEEIYKSGLYSPYIKERLEIMIDITGTPEEHDPPCLDVYSDPRNIAFREMILDVMDKNKIDALIYPSWGNPPRKIGDMESPDGNNSYIISPPTGMPSVTVPMGYVNGNLPAGLQFVGRLFSEPLLIKYIYSYEQATKHRKPPVKFGGIK